MGQIVASIVGRGHGGTRAGISWLRGAGFDIGGERTNASLDRTPFKNIYDAGRICMSEVRHLGGQEWDTARLNTCPIPARWKQLWEEYLHTVTRSRVDRVAWKLPETVLSYPWLARAFPEVHYILWHRDPRTAIMGTHITDRLGEWGVENWPSGLNQQEMRALSWVLQFHLLEGSVRPPHWCRVRLRDFINHQNTAGELVADMLGINSMPGHPLRREALTRGKGHEFRDATIKMMSPYYRHFEPGPLAW